MKLLSVLIVLSMGLAAQAEMSESEIQESQKLIQEASMDTLVNWENAFAKSCPQGKIKFWVRYGAHLIPVTGLMYDIATGQLKRNGKGNLDIADVALGAMGNIGTSAGGTVTFGVLYLASKGISFVEQATAHAFGGGSILIANDTANAAGGVAKDSIKLIYTEARSANSKGKASEQCEKLNLVREEIGRRNSAAIPPAPTGLKIQDLVEQEIANDPVNYSGQD